MIFKSNVQRGEDQYLKGNYHKAAEYFSKAGEWQRAVDCFARSGQIERAIEVAEAHGLYLEAGRFQVELGQHSRASLSFEKAGETRQAAIVARQGRSFERAGRLYEKSGDFAKAAECFTEAGNTTRAVNALAHESDRLQDQRGATLDPVINRQIREIDLRRADILSGLRRHPEAAELYAKHGQHRTAAAMFEKAGAHVDAARNFLDAGQSEKALEAIARVSLAEVDRELLAEIYQSEGKLREAADILKSLDRNTEAAYAYEAAEAWEDAARIWEQEEDLERAAHLYLRAKAYGDAGRCYLAVGQAKSAAGAFAAAQDHEAAAKAYARAGEHYKAGLHFREAGLDDGAREAFLAVEPSEENDHFVRASLLLIPLLVAEGSLDGASRRLKKLQTLDGVPEVDLLYCQGRLAEAEGRGETAEKYYQQVVTEKHDYRDARRRLRTLRNERSATQPTPVVRGPDPRQSGVRATGTRTEVRQTGTRQTGIRQTGTGQTGSRPAGSTQTGTRPALASEPEAAMAEVDVPTVPVVPLPYSQDAALSPWWKGATFFSGRKHSDGSAALLVGFPADAERRKVLETARVRTSRLDHPAILQLVEVTHGGGEDVLVYESFSGRTLDDRLLGGPHGPPPPLAGLQIIVQLCEALAGAHKLGLIHRALSLHTVLVDAEHRVKLAGLGLGELLSTQVHQSLMSPEGRDGGAVGPASDVYSLGRLAITLLQAQMPSDWVDSQSFDLDRVVWNSEVETTIPAKAREVLLRCLDPNPLRRPSMDQLQASLTSIGLLPGQVIADRYEIRGQIGSGGMSRVYRARDRILNDEVAIKTVITPAAGVNNDDEERLLREVQISRKISHPNVVRVHDIGRFPGGIFVSMELLAGPGLDEIIEHEAPLPLDQVKGLLRQIAAALDEAHRFKVIHRDLKPGNVMMGDDGRAKVLDFGIARQSDSSTGHLTRTGEVIGSPLYMAPEQIQGKPLDGTCDLYSLGVITYTLLTGREPFHGDSPTAIVLQHVHDEPPDIRRRRPELPDAWVELLERLLAKDPRGRYPSAEELGRVVAALPETS